MMLYKLTTQDHTTRSDTKWGENVTHKAARGKPVLCSNTVIHAYTTPLLAVLMNSAHANIHDPVLWEAKGEPVISDGAKVGCKSLTTLRVVPLPQITTTQRVAFAIHSALAVYHDEAFKKWANGWLAAMDRTATAATAAANAANTAANVTYAAATAAATAAANAANAANTATYVATAAATAVNVAYTANVAYAAYATIDFAALAEKAMRVKP